MSRPLFFWAFLQLPKLLHNCEDYFHFYSLSAVHMYDFYHIRKIAQPPLPPQKKKSEAGRQK